MKKAFAAALAVAVTGGLVLTAVSGGATTRVAVSEVGDDAERVAARAARTYTGTFKEVGPGTEITIKAGYRNGRAVNIKRMSYLVPMDCQKSPEGTFGSAGWIFRGVRVKRDRRFSVKGNNGEDPVSTLTFKGRFTKSFKKVRGTFRTHQWFEEQLDPPLPAEYCNLAPTKYVARR